MAVEFKESRTRENLMRAFGGESQARNRYTIAAETAREQGLFAISQIFLFTADQERAHAARFYDLLKNLNGTTIAIDGSYPVDQFDNVAELLRAAQHNEMEEAGDVYQAFGKTAREEGFLEVSSAFIQIARIEAVHGKRFGKLAELLEEIRRTFPDKSIWCYSGYLFDKDMVPGGKIYTPFTDRMLCLT